METMTAAQSGKDPLGEARKETLLFSQDRLQ